MRYSSEQLKTTDINCILHPMASIGIIKDVGPHIITSGKGVYFTDSDGETFLACDAGLGATTLGFGRTDLGDVMKRACENMGFYQTTSGVSNPAQIMLAEKLLSYMPGNISKIFFANSGSEANESAIKLVRFYNIHRGFTEKTKIITQKLSYHGSTLATSELTGIEDFHHDFGIVRQNTICVECPAYFKFGLEGESEDEFTARLVQQLEDTILEAGPDTIGAFIAEPIMGCAGVVVPPADYYQKVHDVLKKYQILFIGDEVMCGYGRTGKMFGFEHFGITPDIITSAKGLTSGYFPLSAVGVSEEIWQELARSYNNFGIFFHGFTSCGHPIGAAVALKTLELVEELQVVDNSRLRGVQLLNGLKARLSGNPYIGAIRGMGLFVGIEINACESVRNEHYNDELLRNLIESECRARGLIIRSAPATSSLYIVPPLIINEAEIEQVIDLFERGLIAAMIALDTQQQ